MARSRTTRRTFGLLEERTSAVTGQVVAGIARISIPEINISIPTISLDIPVFGIDRPSWAYPDPFVAGKIRPVGQAAGGVTAALCGSGTSAACNAAIGALGASCAVPGSGAAACAPAVTKHLWASVPEAGDTAASGAASSAGANGARSECGPDEVLTELGCENLMKLLQRRVDAARDTLRSDKSVRDTRLSQAERDAAAEKPFLDPMNNGKAIERQVARTR